MMRSQLPADLQALIGDAAARQDTIGCSGAEIFRLDDGRYLKIAPAHIDLRPERDRLEWLRGKLPVPDVLYFADDGKRRYLLISEIPGLPSFDPSFEPEIVVQRLADGLRQIHAIDISDCPFEQGVDALLVQAHSKLIHGLVDESNFDAERLGGTAQELYPTLITLRPESEERVFAHGDYCLPNVLLDPHTAALQGFIDWGSAGISDPYYDYALCARSITFNLGAAWVQPFYEACGLTEVDQAKITFFQTLDEFF
jgi:aminoglycoside phosphotransferase